MKAPRLILKGNDPHQWGIQHGQTFAAEIKKLYDIRLELTLEKTHFETEADILELATQHIPVLDAFDSELAAEMRGIAKGADLSLAQIILVNHYTDLRDLNSIHPGMSQKSEYDNSDDPGGCTAYYSYNGGAPILGQTWDMHGSAEDFVCYIFVPATERAPACWLFSIMGCVGMTGLNSKGVGMTINNLNSLDAHIGIVWPVLVRSCLKQGSAQTAYEKLMSAPIGSGHHYKIADAQHMFGVETSGIYRELIQTQDNAQYHIHTNHCLSPKLQKSSWVPATSSTHRRYDAIRDVLQATEGRVDAERLYGIFSHVNLQRNQNIPNAVSTCGAWIMDLTTCSILATKGEPKTEAFEQLSFAAF